MKRFLQSWLICTLAVLVATYLVKGIHCGTWMDLCVASLLLGILNALIRPILMLLTFPLLLVTLGLFQLVINAALLYFVGYLLRPHFYVEQFWDAIWGALVISVISIILNALTGAASPPRAPGGRGGPVIDV